MKAFFRKLLSPVVELRDNEFATALMMFTYSFLVMTSYTALKPVTRSQFIKDLGADNLPLVQFAFGILIGFIMQGYAAIVGRMPRRWALPMTLGGLVALLVVFWLWFQSGSQWASTGFYFFGLILGILVISQFWTLANEVYDPRQAKRLFGFIGGGASLGGIAGSSPVVAGQGNRHDQPAAGQRGADDRVPDPGRRHHQAGDARSSRDRSQGARTKASAARKP